MLFVLALDHIGNVFLYFDLYGHGKLDLKFIMAGSNSKSEATKFVQKRCTYLAEIAEENNRTTSFGEKGFCICRHIYLGKQLSPLINNCC